VQQKLNYNNVVGPIFVSIGDEKKLRIFLEKNPKIPSESMVVDNSDTFDSYESVGFTTNFTDTSPADAKQVSLRPPKLSLKEWFTYLSTVAQVSPIPKKMELGGKIPEGVLRLGGTFVIKGNTIVYQWNDRLPGDHPNIDDVVSIAVSA